MVDKAVVFGAWLGRRRDGHTGKGHDDCIICIAVVDELGGRRMMRLVAYCCCLDLGVAINNIIVVII